MSKEVVGLNISKTSSSYRKNQSGIIVYTYDTTSSYKLSGERFTQSWGKEAEGRTGPVTGDGKCIIAPWLPGPAV